jgi:hypothetical protein
VCPPDACAVVRFSARLCIYLLPHTLLANDQQVYLILDEFILGGEFEETSKKVQCALCTHVRVP